MKMIKKEIDRVICGWWFRSSHSHSSVGVGGVYVDGGVVGVWCNGDGGFAPVCVI